ncbi:GIY-YIG nuclease family protein, partial [Echinicola shivajiensis]|uniref:GIY-YIG nuclease family protein n=1 Tax=Echinicola shivajiensis TaxID=1035916 RepID=UPI001BFC9E6D
MSIFKVYILYSKSIDTFYIGFSSDLSQRIDQHREHGIKGSFTNRAEDWELYFSLTCTSESQARSIERHLKKNKSRKYLSNLKKYEAIGRRLLEQ